MLENKYHFEFPQLYKSSSMPGHLRNYLTVT
jgi:hypothetical protein